MTQPTDKKRTTRRRFLAGAAGLAVAGTSLRVRITPRTCHPMSPIGLVNSARVLACALTAIHPNTKSTSFAGPFLADSHA